MTEQDKWLQQAFRRAPLEDGTYEFLGPHINGNPQGLEQDTFEPHGKKVIPELDRTFEGVRTFLEANLIEGIVFWMDGAPVAKIRRKDFGFPWGIK